MHGCCNNDDVDALLFFFFFFALGIGGITCNPSQINSQANKKSGKQSSNQVNSTLAMSFAGGDYTGFFMQLMGNLASDTASQGSNRALS